MSDLTKQEQEHVRRALKYLRARMGKWETVYAALDTDNRAIRQMVAGKEVTASVAFRVARVIGVGVDAVLAGNYAPPGVCPNCGHEFKTDGVARVE